jgi:hypothetical protein
MCLCCVLLRLQAWRGRRLDVVVAAMPQPTYYCSEMQLSPQQLKRRLQHWRQQQELKALLRRFQRSSLSKVLDGPVQQQQQDEEEAEEEAEMFVRCVAVATQLAAGWTRQQQLQQLEGATSKHSSSSSSAAGLGMSSPERSVDWPSVTRQQMLEQQAEQEATGQPSTLQAQVGHAYGKCCFICNAA